jgi:hypothetical protein
MAIEAKAGKLKAGVAKGPERAPVLVDVAPEGYSWTVFSTSRDSKREIRANLQANLNPMVNVSFKTPFLEALRAREKTFSIMLRWTSRTFKELPWADTKAGIDEKEVGAKEAEADWQAALVKMATDEERQTAKDKHEKDIQEAEQKRFEAAKLWADNFFIRCITSQAWIIGIWQVKGAEMSEKDFEAMKTSFIKYFSEPQTIENGCDYISKTTSTKTKNKEAAKPTASFHMYASDGPSGDVISVVGFDLPAHAFNAIDRRMNLSSIHFLPIKGGIEVYDRGKFPTVSVLNEATLLQIQEARASIAFLKTHNRTVTAIEERLDKTKDGCLLNRDPFPSTLFSDLDNVEVEVLKKSA